MSTLYGNSPLAAQVVDAIRSGNAPVLTRLLADNPGLATTRIADTEDSTAARTLLHVATDWPGHFPNGAAIVKVLIHAGAKVNDRFIGRHSETPLHFAASCDDVEVLDTLLDAGADIEASGGVIGGGTPLADAVAFGQWNAANRLIERGAKTNLWQAAALGLMDRVQSCFHGEALPTPDEVTQAFWVACHGGQQETAEFLLRHGADINWVGYDGLTPLDAAQRSQANGLAAWLSNQGARSAKESGN